MQRRSKFLSGVLVAALVATAAPATAQPLNSYALVRANHEEARADRGAAIERCAASISQAFATAGKTVFDIIGYEHPVSGTLRVHGTATFASSARPVEFSCDVDSNGNLRRLNLASAK